MPETMIKMEALGEWHEVCTSCRRQFKRGETMNVIILDNEMPSAVWCNACCRSSVKEKPCIT